MKEIKLTEPDSLDRAFLEGSKIKDIDVPKDSRDPVLFQTTLTRDEVIHLIQKYNSIFTPQVSENIRCGSTLKLFQERLKNYYNY